MIPQDLALLLLVLVALLVVFFVVTGSRPKRHSQKNEKPERMKELVIPCDSSAQAILFSLFQREGVKYREQAFRSGPYAWTQMPACLGLVPEEEYDHAAEILKNFLDHGAFDS